MEIIKRFKNFFDKKSKWRCNDVLEFATKKEILNDYFLDIIDMGIKPSYYILSGDTNDIIRLYLDSSQISSRVTGINEEFIINLDAEIKNSLSHLLNDFNIFIFTWLIS